MKPKPINWPTSEPEWWWMRFRLTHRSKWQILLVRVIQQFGIEYVEPFLDKKCFARTKCEGWEASFLPAGSPPEPEEWR